MQLAILITVIATLTLAHSDSAAESTSSGELAEPWLIVWVTLGLAAVNAAVSCGGGAWFASRLRAERRGRAVALTFRWWRRLRLAIWMATSTVILVGLHWPQLVRHKLGLDGAVLIDELLCLLPVLLPVLAFWWADFHLDQALPADTRRSPAKDGFARFVATQVRQHLLLCILPVLLLTTADDLLGWLWPAENQAILAFAVTIVALFLGFPYLLRWTWDARPLPVSLLRTRLLQMNASLRLGVSEILVWRTGGTMANAAVAGFTPWNRVLLLTDQLLEELSVEDIEAVWAHEAAHIRRRHLFLRLSVLFVPLAFVLAARDWSWLSLSNSFSWGIGSLLMIPLLVLLLGWVSRFCEFDADLWACRRSGAICEESVTRFTAALRKLGELSGGAHRDSWLHPSIDRRIRRLRDASSSPAMAHRQDRRMLWLRSAAGGLIIVSALLALIGS